LQSKAADASHVGSARSLGWELCREKVKATDAFHAFRRWRNAYNTQRGWPSDDEAKFISKWRPICWAVAYGDVTLVRELSRARDIFEAYVFSKGEHINPLVVAAWFDQPASVDLLLSSGVICNIEATHAAAANSANVLSKLQKAGATIYNKDVPRAWTPLHSAAGNGNLAAVKLLLSWHPGLVYMHDSSDRKTALHTAAYRGHLEICRLLLELDPDGANVKTSDGGQALHFAALEGHGDIVKFLLDRSPESILNQTSYGSLAIHLAAQNGHRDVVELLLNRDATSLRAVNEYGEVALHYAVEYRQQSIVKFLLSRDAGLVNMPTEFKGNMPLHIASDVGDESMMNLLIQAGAETEPKNKAGHTAAELLRRYKVAHPSLKK